jgi:hypothetical protein
MWNKIKTEVWNAVSFYESELRGLSGNEKRVAVIDFLVGKIDWPYVPDLIEVPLEKIVYGYLIDQACYWWNTLTGGDFLGVTLTEEQTAKAVEMLESEPAVIPEALETSSVDEKLNALYAKYAESK